jgi:hypothetical protein
MQIPLLIPGTPIILALTKAKDAKSKRGKKDALIKIASCIFLFSPLKETDIGIALNVRNAKKSG